MQTYNSFKEFYPYYLGEHSNSTCRRLHFVGTSLVILTALTMLLTQNWLLLIALPLVGYGFAWVGHFFFEKKIPSNEYPLDCLNFGSRPPPKKTKEHPQNQYSINRITGHSTVADSE